MIFPHVLFLMIVVLVTITGGSIGMWMTERQPPTRQVSHKVLTPEVRPGGDLRVEFRLIRSRTDCSYHADRILVGSDGERISLDDLSYETLPGEVGDHSHRMTIPVPTRMVQGEATYLMLLTYKCNPIHRMLWPVHDRIAVKFQIKGDPIVDKKSDNESEMLRERLDTLGRRMDLRFQ